MTQQSFAYEELKTRVPEPDEEMSGRKALNYFKDKTRKKKGVSWYQLVVKDIYSRTSFRNGSVLDVGCGPGGLLREFESTNPKLKLIGIDASKTLLNAARKLSKMDLQFAYADDLKFKKDSFDLVVCQDTFHHFRKPIDVLKEIYRVTKKGGYIYITDLRRDAAKDMIGLATKNITRNSISHAIFYLQSVKASYTAQEIETLLKKAHIRNFKIINGKYNSSTEKIIKSIADPERREDKDRLFKERWVVIIRKSNQ